MDWYQVVLVHYEHRWTRIYPMFATSPLNAFARALSVDAEQYPGDTFAATHSTKPWLTSYDVIRGEWTGVSDINDDDDDTE